MVKLGHDSLTQTAAKHNAAQRSLISSRQRFLLGHVHVALASDAGQITLHAPSYGRVHDQMIKTKIADLLRRHRQGPFVILSFIPSKKNYEYEVKHLCIA